MSEQFASIILPALMEYATKLRHTEGWEPFRPGVTARWLYGDFRAGPSAMLLRYEPGARVAEHEHVGYEHMFVIDGDQFDEHGTYPAGTFVVNPPGTRHSPGSTGGCVALLIYEKPVRFAKS